jgi:hypothetical protein
MPRTPSKHDHPGTPPDHTGPPQLSRGDPTPGASRGRPPVVLMIVIALVLAGFVVLHLTGVMGPGMH